MLKSLNVTFDLMQVLAVGLTISQHVGEQSNETCRIAQPGPWHIVPGNYQTSGLTFKGSNAFHFS